MNTNISLTNLCINTEQQMYKAVKLKALIMCLFVYYHIILESGSVIFPEDYKPSKRSVDPPIAGEINALKTPSS